MSVECRCPNCKLPISTGHTGPCPHCGIAAGKDCASTVSLKVGLALSLTAKHGHITWEWHGVEYRPCEVLVLGLALTTFGWCLGTLVNNGLVGLGIALLITALDFRKGAKPRWQESLVSP